LEKKKKKKKVGGEKIEIYTILKNKKEFMNDEQDD